MKHHFKLHMFGLNHDRSSDFYLSCFQRSESVIPLLLIRIFMFLACLATLAISLRNPSIHWPIYMTNWGVFLITVTSLFAVIVSCMAYFKAPFDSLPWYIKTYWILLTITVPISIFITGFYYIMLFDNEALTGERDPWYLAQDFLAHATNSVVMLVLLIASRTPYRILHFYFPVGTGLVYMIFSVIYYAAGGTDMYGNHTIYPILDWSDPGPTTILVVISTAVIIGIHLVLAGYGNHTIYPILDWSDPGPTTILVVISAAVIIGIHLVLAGFTALRNVVTKSCRKNSKNYDLA